MSKAVYICLNPNRSADVVDRQAQVFVKKIEALEEKLIPSIIVPKLTRIINQDGLLLGIWNPVDAISVVDTNLCLGSLIDEKAWFHTGDNRPDGSYAIFRSDDTQVEVLSDGAGSRTIWYYLDQDVFMAATSQHALIALLGGFEFNAAVIPWMLSTGSLGPGVQGWDRRIQRLLPDSILRLDRRAWTLSIHTDPIAFEPVQGMEIEHYGRVRRSLHADFATMHLNYDHWRLLLSGGYDSRAILYLLPIRAGLRTVTWGEKSARDEKLTDAEIAVRLAQHAQVPNDYFALDDAFGADRAQESIAGVFERFLTAGEGRVDHVGGYMDGFQIWKRLFEDGVQGVIRGDEGFGWVTVSTPAQVRTRVGIGLWEDFANAESLSRFDLPQQDMPEELDQLPGESLATWRDRLYHAFRMPVVLAALNDLKLPFVELTNPLLSRNTLYAVRTLPDSLRTEKELYTRIVDELAPPIPIAKYASILYSENALKSAGAVDYLRQELATQGDSLVLPKAFVDYALNGLAVWEPGKVKMRQRLREQVKDMLPPWVRDFARSTVAKPRIDGNALAFRCYIVSRMYHNLSEAGRSGE